MPAWVDDTGGSSHQSSFASPHWPSGSVFSNTAKEVQDFRSRVNVHLHEFSKDFVHLHERPPDLALQSYSVGAVRSQKFREEVMAGRTCPASWLWTSLIFAARVGAQACWSFAECGGAQAPLKATSPGPGAAESY